MPLTSVLHWAAISLLNGSLAWLVGALFVRMWISGSEGTWTDSVLRRLDFSFFVACIICGVGSIANLWIAAAAMGDVPLSDASEAFQTMLTSTSYGRLGLYGLVLLTALALFYAFYSNPRNRQAQTWLIGLLLGAFMFTRAASSHAAEGGVFRLAVAIDWLHIAFMACWVGIVLVSGFVALPRAQLRPLPDRHVTQRFLLSLSTTATVALIGILATGVYNAYHGLRNLEDLVSTTWGQALTVKLCLIAVAVALGGYNRFAGFPAVLDETDKEQFLKAGMERLKTVLYVEAALLVGAVVAAAVLASEVAPTVS